MELWLFLLCNLLYKGLSKYKYVSILPKLQYLTICVFCLNINFNQIRSKASG